MRKILRKKANAVKQLFENHNAQGRATTISIFPENEQQQIYSIRIEQNEMLVLTVPLGSNSIVNNSNLIQEYRFQILEDQGETMLTVHSKQYIGKIIDDKVEEEFNPGEYDVYKFIVTFNSGEKGIAYKKVHRFSEDKHRDLINAPWLFECPKITTDAFGNNPPQVSDLFVTAREFVQMLDRYIELNDGSPNRTQEEKDELAALHKIMKDFKMECYF